MISQEDASRIMFAAEKWAKAALTLGRASPGWEKQHGRHAERAKQAFADLIATLTDSEGL